MRYRRVRRIKHRDYNNSIYSDAHAKDNTSREVKEQVYFLQTLIDSIPSPIFYKDKNAIYQGCNKAFEAYIGLNRGQIVGKTVYDLAPPDLADTYHAADLELLSRMGTQVYESDVVYADGSRHNVIFNKATYQDSNNQKKGLVGVISDITERRQAEKALGETMHKLRKISDQIVQAMAAISEMRDLYTAGHQERVSELSAKIAQRMGLKDEQINAVKVAGLLHDIGKISIPSEILTKPGKLSIPEFEIIKSHPQVGYEVLKKIDFPWKIAEIVLQHHERLDGSGYPNGIKSEEILLEAKIIAVADVVEAMSSHRPYRPSLGVHAALAEIKARQGRYYDPEVVEACLAIYNEEHDWLAEK